MIKEKPLRILGSISAWAAVLFGVFLIFAGIVLSTIAWGTDLLALFISGILSIYVGLSNRKGYLSNQLTARAIKLFTGREVNLNPVQFHTAQIFLCLSMLPVFISAYFISAPPSENEKEFGAIPKKEFFSGLYPGVEEYLTSAAFDSDSMKIKCDDRVRTSYKGWVAYCDVNGRNRFGGMAGWRRMEFTYRDGNLIDVDQ